MSQGTFFGPPAPLALSVRQPWAWLIVAGFKDIENRTWRTEYRGTLYIHAALRLAEMTIGEIEEWQGRKFKREAPFDFGGIIGQVDLIACVDKHASPWFEGPWGWVLANPRLLPYRPCKGSLSLFTPKP